MTWKIDWFSVCCCAVLLFFLGAVFRGACLILILLGVHLWPTSWVLTTMLADIVMTTVMIIAVVLIADMEDENERPKYFRA